MSKRFRIFTDGGARGNPGPAGIGGVVQAFDESAAEFRTVKTVSAYIGETTNNQAEYRALLATLEETAKLGAEEVECVLDSELIVKQLNHEYKVKDQNLAPLYVKVWNLAQGLRTATFRHVPRAQNKEADKLVNKAIDEALRGRV